ncbi:MAG: protein BatD [Sphingobacteriales bacterium]|nr:protein BatD [Sphingobacteriales bacterium]
MRSSVRNRNINNSHLFSGSAFCAFLLLLLTAGTAFAQKFTAIANTREVPLNYTFDITYSVENGDMQKFTPPRFEAFDTYGPAQSTNVSIINGKMSKSVSYTYTLQPKRQGEFTIPPATAVINGSEMKSNPVNIVVTAPSKQSQQSQQYQDPFDAFRRQSQPQRRQSSDEDIRKEVEKNIFVRVIPSKTQLYQGDQVSLSYKLYFRIQYQTLQATKNPSYNGFLSEEFKLPEPDRNEQPPIEVYGGRKYYVQEFKRVSLFPTKSGKITIDPIELQGTVLLEVPDPFFGGFFSTLEPYDYEFKSNAIDLDIKSLPEKNKPAAFSGAVGKFSFEAGYDKKNVKVGDEIKLKITYNGTGNLKLITAPKLAFPEEFEAFEPKTKDDYSNNGSVVTGSKSFEYILIPQDGGKFKLPLYEFAYFDVEKGDYVRFTLPETEIEVEGKAKISENVISFFKREKEDRPKSIYGIKTTYAASSDFAGSNRFWMLTVSPFMILLLGFIFRKRDYSESELLSLRRKKANRIALRKMAKAKKLLEQHQEEAFYNEVIRALWEYLSDKLAIPQSELSKENISERLSFRNVTADKIQSLVETLDTCEQSLFSPAGQQHAMQQTYSRSVELIVDIEEQLKAKNS